MLWEFLVPEEKSYKGTMKKLLKVPQSPLYLKKKNKLEIIMKNYLLCNFLINHIVFFSVDHLIKM